MQFEDKELHLIRLGLNSAAHDGETSNCGAALFKILRKRGITAEQFSNSSSSGGANYEHAYRSERQTSEMLRHTVTRLQADVARLTDLLRQKGTGTSYSTGTSSSTGATRRPRTKYGSAVLSDKERDFVKRFGEAATRWSGNSGGTLRSFCQTHKEFGTIQQCMRKGMIEKRGPRKHGLTEAGVAYYAKYCTGGT